MLTFRRLVCVCLANLVVTFVDTQSDGHIPPTVTSEEIRCKPTPHCTSNCHTNISCCTGHVTDQLEPGSICHSGIVNQVGDVTSQLFSFYVINECGGCDVNRTTCKERDVNNSELSPVFVKSVNKHFYNKQCANHHGYTSLIAWNLTLFCTNISMIGASEFLGVNTARPLKQQDLTKECVVRYMPPVQTFLMGSSTICSPIPEFCEEKEFVDWMSSCKSRASNEVNPINTGDDISDMTNCFLCYTDVPNVIHCKIMDYITFGDFQFIGQYSDIFVPLNTPAAQTVAIETCDDDHNKMLFGRCRRTECPLGQFMSTRTQTCETIFFTWTGSPIFMWLKLVPLSSGDMPSENVPPLSRDDVNVIWPTNTHNFWKLDFIWMHYHGNSVGRKVDYLVIKLVFRDTHRPGDIALLYIRSTIMAPWTLDVRGRNLTYVATFNKYSEYQPIGGDGTAFRPAPMSAQPSSMFGEETVYANDTYISRPGIIVTKLFICPMVTLQPDEVDAVNSGDTGNVSDTTSSTVFVRSAGKYLGNNEFMFFRDFDGRLKIKVCGDEFLNEVKEVTPSLARRQLEMTFMDVIVLVAILNVFFM